MQVKTLNAKQLSNFKALGQDYNVHFLENILEAAEINEPFFLLGKGTNVLLVTPQHDIIVSTKLLDKITFLGGTLVQTEAGVSLPELINQAKRKNLGGLEFTFPVPASVGGAIYQNFGAYAQEIGTYVKEVTTYSQITKEIVKHKINNQQDFFSYRDSYFKQNKLVILKALFSLTEMEPENIENKLSEVSSKRLALYPMSNTLGSIFKNGETYSTGKILDELGMKGFAYKHSQVCTNHANVIIATKQSRCLELLELITILKKTAKTKKNIELYEEIFIY